MTRLGMRQKFPVVTKDELHEPKKKPPRRSRGGASGRTVAWAPRAAISAASGPAPPRATPHRQLPLLIAMSRENKPARARSHENPLGQQTLFFVNDDGNKVQRHRNHRRPPTVRNAITRAHWVRAARVERRIIGSKLVDMSLGSIMSRATLERSSQVRGKTKWKNDADNGLRANPRTYADLASNDESAPAKQVRTRRLNLVAAGLAPRWAHPPLTSHPSSTVRFRAVKSDCFDWRRSMGTRGEELTAPGHGEDSSKE
uniref:Uncharacterized protein n=1 Tax=Steinernema glaseri TaxID=37863 RepID=A0A1I7Z2K0_9BILA